MKHLQRILCGLLAAFLLAALPVSVLAEESPPAPRKVRVACGFSNALYLDSGGKPQGYCSHYLRQIAWLQNWELEYVEVTWSEGLSKMRTGDVDLMLPVQLSEQRQEYLDFSQYSSGYEGIGLYAPADADVCFDEYDALNHKTIGVEADNRSSQELETFAAQHGLTYTLTEYPSAAALHSALALGRVDMVVSSTMNTVPESKLVAVLDYLPFYFCTRKGDASLLSELNAGMRYVMINSPDMISDVFDSTLKGTVEIGYTKEETAIIAGTDKIVFGMYDNSLPLSGTDAEGNPIGIYVDLLKKIEKLTGITMEPRIISTDDFLFDPLQNGTVDYVMCSNRLPYTCPDTSIFLGSDPIADYATVAITRPDYNLDKATHPVFALTTYRTYLADRIAADYPGAEILYYPTAKDCMIAVQSKKADATFLNSWEYNYQSKNARFQGMMEWENTRIASSVIVVTNAGKNEEWLNIVDKAFHQIDSDELADIIAQNVNMPYLSYDASDRVYTVWNNAKMFLAVLLFLLVLLVLYLYMRRKNIRALKEKNQELEAANEAKSAFLSRMSHELRTPLNAISGYAQEQENNCMSPHFDVKAELDSVLAIRRAVRYQLSIIGDLLNIHQIESGRIRLAKEDVDATAFMDAVVEMIRPEAEAKEINFTYDRLTATNETYRIDPIRVQQILFNLLHNAIKFTPQGGTVHLTAQAAAQEGNLVRLRFVVADTGIGMSPDFVQTRLFQNFAQEHVGTTSPYEGCGIGLATCRELVNLMGGTITCESTQGEGSVFTVEIEAEATQKKRRERKKREPVPCDLQGVHILLCEDNPMNQDIEKRLLERLGCTVDLAGNGRVGCELFAQSAPGAYSLVLMDIRMPEMDGLQAAQAIRAMPRADAKTVPILAVSANAFEADVQKSLAAGMNEHLSKPMDVRLIREKIRLYCAPKG